MDFSQVLGIVGVVVVAFVTAAGGYITARSGGRVSPYDSLAKRVTDLEQQRVEDVETMEAQHAKIAELERQRASDQTEIAGLQRRVAGMFDDRDDLVLYIVTLHAWVAAGAKPPAPKVPAHLAEVVPPWVPGDGAAPAQKATNPEEAP